MPKHIFPPSSRPGRQSRRRRPSISAGFDAGPGRLCASYGRGPREVHAWQQRCGVAGAQLDRYPTPPGAPQDDGLSSYSDSMCEGGNATRPTTRPWAQGHPPGPGQFWVRKDYSYPEGNAPLCYVTTGYYGPRPRTATTTKSTCATTSPTFNGQSAWSFI